MTGIHLCVSHNRPAIVWFLSKRYRALITPGVLFLYIAFEHRQSLWVARHTLTRNAASANAARNLHGTNLDQLASSREWAGAFGLWCFCVKRQPSRASFFPVAAAWSVQEAAGARIICVHTGAGKVAVRDSSALRESYRDCAHPHARVPVRCCV